MRIRSFLLLLVSLVLGFVVIQWVRGTQNRDMSQTQNQAVATVIVAVGPLNLGEHIAPTDVRAAKWPADGVPPGAFTSMDELVGSGQDRVVLRPMDAGEPVLASKVSGKGGRATLSTIIDPNLRAVTIHVTDTTGVAGFVLPGDRVDVMLTRGDNREHSQAQYLLQYVKVLAIDQEASDRKEKPTLVKAVTLEVTPADAQKLTLGSGIGILSLTLRNIADTQSVPNTPLLVSDLPGSLKPVAPIVAPGAPPPRAQAAKPPRNEIEVLRGTDSTSYEIQMGGAVGGGGTKSSRPAPKTSSAEPGTPAQTAVASTP
jgi:pilus assembly protein CpaB